MDLSGLTVAQLRVLQEQVKQSLKDREHEEMTKAREQILAIAQSAGISLKNRIIVPRASCASRTERACDSAESGSALLSNIWFNAATIRRAGFATLDRTETTSAAGTDLVSLCS